MSVSRERVIESQLDQSERNRKLQEIQQSAGMQICNQMDAILEDEEKIPDKLSMHKMIAARDSLADANKKLKKIVMSEEVPRGGAGIMTELTNKVKTTQHQYESLKHQLAILHKSYEQDKANYETDINAIPLKIAAESDSDLQQSAKAEQKLGVLKEQRNIRKDKYDKAVLAYNKKCCCLSSFLADEKNAEEKAKADLDAIEEEILEIHVTSDTAKAKIAEYKKTLNDLTSAKRKLIDEYPVKVKQLEEAIIEARKVFNSAEAIYKIEEKKKKSEVSNLSMLYYLRVYVCFEKFSQLVYDLDEKNSRTKDLAHFQERLQLEYLSLNPLMKKIWCQDAARRNGFQIYRDIYCGRLSVEEREAVLAGKFDQALQDTIVPFCPRGSVNTHSTLFAKPSVPPLAAAPVLPGLTPKRS